MVEALEEQADISSREVAERVREEYINEAEQARQGAEGLADHVSEVKQTRDARGQFTSSYSFEVNHPFAELHERGGHIEPQYAKAAAKGWTRDEMYHALEDCNEYVERKRILGKAIAKVR